MMTNQDRALLMRMFDAAIQAADPKTALLPFLPDPPKGRTIVIGAGKGAAQMAAALEDLWNGPLEGTVVTRYDYGGPTRHIRVLEASHPVPDQAGLDATATLQALVSNLTSDDLVIALICGGGSALLPAPPEGLSLEDEQSLNRVLLGSGAPISVMNAIRKQVSQIKGGRLAAMAAPARVVSLVVSDVPGDDPAQVASGPTIPDTSDRKLALDFVDSYAMDLPPNVADYLRRSPDSTPDPNDPVFQRNEVHIVASAAISLEAAAHVARADGVTPVILSDAIEGEARDVGFVHAAIAREVRLRNRPFPTPTVILSGGETTVSIRDKAGRGGRNTEFLLALAKGVEGLEIAALAADTDGIDGSESNAGAFADGSSWTRLRTLGQEPDSLLSGHDAWTAFDALGDLFAPGPTGTNVNDFRAILLR